MKPSIYNETDPLQEVLVWGEPGIEALLGQLLPKSKSLFFSYYDVLEARREFRNMQALIENEGITFTRAKDALAQALQTNPIPNEPKSITELENALLQRVNDYYENYRQQKISEFIETGINTSIDEVFLEIKKNIKKVLLEDRRAYGDIPALRLNYLLSLSFQLPLSNIFYGRDQSQVLADKIILSSLKWDIRKPEVGIFKQALVELGYAERLVEIDDGVIEGGDIAILGGTCYIGVGARTDMRAVKNLYEKIGHYLNEQGIQIVAVVNKRHEVEAAGTDAPTEEHMRIMHLDMFWIPLAPDLVMAYGHELDQRDAICFSNDENGIKMESAGGFREYLSSKQIEIMEVNEAEQKNFATNLLHLGNKTVIMALSTNTRVIEELEARGFRVLSAELNKLVGGYGATHCLTAPIRRSKK